MLVFFAMSVLSTILMTSFDYEYILFSERTQNGHVGEISKEKRRVNQFGDYEDTSNMTVKDWEYRWSKEQTQFHMPKYHP